MYYLDREYTLQEYCYSEGRGWFTGEIGKMNVKTSTSTRIGAIQYGDDEGGVHIRVYYQGECYLSLKRHPFVETPRRGRHSGHRGVMQRWSLVQRGAASTRRSRRYKHCGYDIQLEQPNPSPSLLPSRRPISQGTLLRQQRMVPRSVRQCTSIPPI